MKYILGILSLLLLVLSAHSVQEFQSRYRRVESYEIRPGILVTPKYAEDGTLCRVSIERPHVQPDVVELGPSTMPRKLVLEMIDELAPPSVRGQATVQLAGSDYISVTSGSADIETANYQNLSAQIYTTTSASGDIAVVLQWKKKACESSKISTPKR